MKITGVVTPSKNRPLELGRVDNKRVNVYKMPINETGSLRFAMKGVRADRCELMVNNVLIAVIKPAYEKTWTSEDIIPLEFFGDALFHKSLLSCPVEIVVTTESNDLPSIMVGITNIVTTWDTVPRLYNTRIYKDLVTVGSDSGLKKMTLVYTPDGCGFESAPIE